MFRKLASVLIILLMGFHIYYQKQLKKTKADFAIYKNNMEVLVTSAEFYRNKDSLRVARVGALELKLAEFRRFRAEDAGLIESLRTRERSLERSIRSVLTTTAWIKGGLKDSVVTVYKDTGKLSYDTIRCLDIEDNWFQLKGCLYGDKFSGYYSTTDSLLVAETVTYKRFLGFLWRTGKIKDRKVDVVSRNPNTRIEDVEYIHIRQ